MRTRALSLRRAAGEPIRAAVACGKLGGLDVFLIGLLPVAPTTWRRGLASRQSTSRPSFVSCCRVPQRAVFVRFQPTPNDACYKFYVDEMQFLPPNAHTMVFNSTNSYISPLAHTLLEALPMVEEVTVGTSFVTVKRVEEANAAAAARYFAMKLNRVQQNHETDEEAAAARSQALQQRVADALKKDGETAAEPRSCNAASTAPPLSPADAPFDVGGFTVSPSSQDEQIDEAALQSLIAETDWSELKLHVSALLTDHICSGNPHVDPSAPHPHADTVPEEGDSEVVLMIKELVSTTIRPQLQDDGGDLRFVGFDPVLGDMHVELLGACRTCKSSKTTLVDLIERTTRHWIPEVSAVKDVSRATSAFEDFAAHHSNAAAAGAAGLSSSPLTDRIAGEVDDGSPNAKGTVQFSPSPTSVSARAASGAYKMVRKVQASSAGEAGTACSAAAPS
ncbi:NifU-like domain family protein [Leishmania donovani]|uniref:NifU-like domain family protein n=1 Tax=Leishmania donovani TaxID=5661 RepID=A0A504Y3M9_LEIDO|nr:NifU-like domain family protein [Leishmania donovani]